MRNTSVKSYYELVESGELSKKQIEVANCFKKWGAMTGRQVTDIIPGAWKRCRELADLGILKSIGTTKDYNTGKIVNKWAWCGDQPLMVPIKQDKSIKKLSPLYDKAFEAGVRDAMFYMYGEMVAEETIQKILEVSK